MTMYHVDWNTAGYQACTNPACTEEFHSPSKIECVREYDRTMAPIYRQEGLATLPPVWTKSRRPSRSRSY